MVAAVVPEPPLAGAADPVAAELPLSLVAACSAGAPAPPQATAARRTIVSTAPSAMAGEIISRFGFNCPPQVFRHLTLYEISRSSHLQLWETVFRCLYRLLSR